MPRLRTIVTMAALALAVFGFSPASAEIHNGGLTIVATSASGDVATFFIDAPVDAPFWTWSSSERIEMRSPTTGDLIAILNPDGKESSVTYIDDPTITVAFAVQAGAVPTTFVITSGVLSFPPFNAEGRATVGMSVSDTDGDGATLTGNHSGGGSYLAQYNGISTFTELITGIVAGAYSSSTASADFPPVGFAPMGSLSDMSVVIDFDLTANDQASGTSTYVTRDFPLAVENVSWGKVKSLYTK
jgi:hypothetical protein